MLHDCRPDLCFEVPRLLAGVTKGSRQALVDINTAITRAKEQALELRFPAALDLSTCSVATFSDASWGNRSDGSSQGGYIHTLIGEEALSGKEVPLAIMEWSSQRSGGCAGAPSRPRRRACALPWRELIV